MPVRGEKEGVMPKEVISDGFVRTEVRWSKDGRVQIATAGPDGATLEPVAEGNGWYADYDRTDINTLIRTLRRARDAAFGADA